MRLGLLNAAIARRKQRVLGGDDSDTTPSASTSSAVLSAATVATGEDLTLTITARNAGGQSLSGKVVTSVTLDPVGSGTITGSGNTNGSGVATRTLTGGDIAAGNTVTVVVDGVTLDDVPVFEVTAATGTMWADIWQDIWGDIWAVA